MAASRRYEFKVEYGCSRSEEKWTKFYIEQDEMNFLNVETLVERLQQKCGGFPCMKMKYLDRSLDWIDLSQEDMDSFIDMVETAQVVPERDNILRITLKISNIVSPAYKQVLPSDTGKRIHSPSPVKIKKRSRSRLDYEPASTVNVYVTPTQKLFDKLQTDKRELQSKVAKKEHELRELEQSFERAVRNSIQGAPLCTKCHTGGHNRTRCTFATCISATICGDIKRHPEENKYLKDQKDELKALKVKLTKIEQDIKSKEEAYKSVKNTFAAQVQSDLINSDPKRYLRPTLQGHSVPNWLLVNSDIRKLERICHGKVPAKAEIPKLFKTYNDNFDILQDSPNIQNRVHPVKDLWEKKGVKFPGKGTVPNSLWSQQQSVSHAATRTVCSDSSDEFEGLDLLFQAATFLDDV